MFFGLYYIFPLKQAFPSPFLDTTDLFYALTLSLWNTTEIFLPQPYTSPATQYHCQNKILNLTTSLHFL